MVIVKGVKFIQAGLPIAIFNLLQNFFPKCKRKTSERMKCSRSDASMYQISLLHNLYISSAEHVQEKLPA
jgi:hypothetical protein